MRIESSNLMALLLGCLLSTFAVECRAQSGDDPEATNILRTYEVGDLILHISDRPYSPSPGQQSPFGGAGRGGMGGGGMGGGAGMGGGRGVFSVPVASSAAPTRLTQFGGGGGGRGGGMGGGMMGRQHHTTETQITIDSLIEAILTTVKPDYWNENGTGDGRITSVGTALVVLNTPSVHQEIEGLLTALRAGSGSRKTLNIDARWLLLNSEDLNKLVPAGDSLVDPDSLKKFTRAPGSIRGMTNCFSGQLVYLVSGTRRNMVETYIPVVGSVEFEQGEERLLAQQPAAPRSRLAVKFVSDSSAPAGDRGVGYQPIIRTPNFGALLEIRPTWVQGESRVTVDLQSTVTVPSDRQEVVAKRQSDPAGAPVVDRIAIETQQLTTTLRIPLGKPYLVGGMTYAPATNAANGGPNGLPRNPSCIWCWKLSKLPSAIRSKATGLFTWRSLTQFPRRYPPPGVG